MRLTVRGVVNAGKAWAGTPTRAAPANLLEICAGNVPPATLMPRTIISFCERG